MSTAAISQFIFMGTLTCAWGPQIRRYAQQWHVRRVAERAPVERGLLTVYQDLDGGAYGDLREDDHAVYIAPLFRPSLSDLFFVDRSGFAPDAKPEGSPAVEKDPDAPLRLVVFERCATTTEVEAGRLAVVEKFGASQKVSRLEIAGAIFALIVERDVCDIGFVWVGPVV